MKYRGLGESNLEVSCLCFGTMLFGNPLTEDDAISLVEQAIDGGINFFDTANIYEGYSRYIGSAGGIAETILGKALKGKRDRVFITTKVGMDIGTGPYDRGLSPRHILNEIDRSLQRLKTDYVDLYLLHKPDPETPLEDTLSVLKGLAKEGKIRHWGVSNFSSFQIREILELCHSHHWPRPVVNQSHHSLINREIEKEELPLCEKEGIDVTSYRIFEGGWLTGKYHSLSKFPPGTRAIEKRDWMTNIDKKKFSIVRMLKKMANEINKPLSQYSIAWELTHSGINSVIIGVKTSAQLKDCMAALEWTFPEHHLVIIDRILGPH